MIIFLNSFNRSGFKLNWNLFPVLWDLNTHTPCSCTSLRLKTVGFSLNSENCALLGCYAASSGNGLPSLGTDRFPETSAINCHHSLRKNPEGRSSRLLRGGSLKLRTIYIFVCSFDVARLLGPRGVAGGVATVGLKNTYAMFLGDRGGTVVKVLCYKSEGRWFDPSWYHWNFSLT